MKSEPSVKIKEEGIVGFGDDEDDVVRNSKKGTNKKSGGFENMGLSFPVLKGIKKRGYKIPTPIQRKTIPLVVEGRDVVAMARTGSGKTACFLIPLFEKLKVHNSRTGTRALILSPTRELALQTQRFVKELGQYTGLRSAVVLGGDAMEQQFSAIRDNPDIIVATPGRFLHLCVEMDLKLNNVQYVVFDEADRLFEMGFGEQLNEIVQRLPDTRQTVLFSATLPKVLVEFAKAGLSDPVLIRLDVETKIPDTLNLSFLACRSDEKPAVLLSILKHAVKKESLTIIFTATKHHVEYLHTLLEKSGFPNAYIYSDLDPSARKISVAKFQSKKVRILVVTDVAARGIDIPHLDYVINYNFPAKPKLFVHRVGRCARAGREGHAFCIVEPDEFCYLLDLHLFLGNPLTIAPPSGGTEISSLGKVPSTYLETELSDLLKWHTDASDLASMQKVCENGMKQYIRSRPGASIESVKRAKDIGFATIGEHPLFQEATNDKEAKAKLLTGISSYRPPGTIFELGRPSYSDSYKLMRERRQKHDEKIIAYHQKVQEKLAESEAIRESRTDLKMELSKPEDIGSTFSKVVMGKRRKTFTLSELAEKKQKILLDKEHFIPYQPADVHTEEGLQVHNFQKEASVAGFDLTGDTEAIMKSAKVKKVWDKKKKKMVGVQGESKKNMIKSESGKWIPSSYKSGRYQKWMEKTLQLTMTLEVTTERQVLLNLLNASRRTNDGRNTILNYK
uniref:RNA helicase n=1 Tax=Lygus hesperus TaxID=30085 RepID=A0A0K8T610_LYGHE